MRRLLRKMVMVVAGSLVAGSAWAAQQPVIIGSTNFTEQLILANIYADVLQCRGVPVEMRLNLGSREIVFPALKAGEIDVLPEYTGAMLAYLTADEGGTRANTKQEVLSGLHRELPDDLVMLEPSSAQDKDALVVTQQTAEKYNLQTIADLKGVAPKLVMGGPPEFETRFVGLPGLAELYGIHFKDFVALDAGGPLTVAALKNGDIDVALMFTTQGVIDANNWVVLKDTKNWIMPQQIVPVVRKEVLTPTIRTALNAISAELTTEGLQHLNAQVGLHNRIPRRVARDWVKEHGLC